MTLERISVLLVEDNPADARLLREAVREVEGSQIRLSHADTLSSALERLEQEHFDVIMLDLSLPDADGLETVRRAHARAPGVPIVVLTGLDDEDVAIRAVREGAQDYLVKGQVTSHLLVRAMRYATERKRAIEALQRSEEYYRSLIENALDVITVLDRDGRVRYGSPSFERVLGYAPGSLTGANAFELLHPSDRNEVRRMLETGTAHPGATQRFECRFQHADGTWRVFESIGKRFDSQPSSLTGYVLNSRDITERKRADEQLRQANETIRAVIEASPLAVYVLDLHGKIRTWNPAAEEMFGYSAAEAVGQPASIVFSDDEHSFLRRIEDAAEGHLATGSEHRARRKDGSLIDVSVWNSLLRDESGAVTGIVEAVADNSERKRLEEQFRQAQKMEAVGRLAGGVAHDFNNLLTVITGYCAMMVDQVEAGSGIAADLQQILKAAERATALTRQLLAFSRRQVVQPKVVELDSLIDDMHPMLRRLLGENVELVIRTGAPGCKIRVDPGHLEQVIINLTVNARDAMPRGGTLTIETSSRTLEEDGPSRVITLRPGDYAVVEVSDTGIGMDEETLSHLFEPFFTTKEKGRGTGLGLSTSYGIVKQNHGEIVVHSQPGVGTLFTIYLPLVRETPVPERRKADATRSFGGNEVILVAEDEDPVRTVMTDMLRKQGYNVLAAPGGYEALDMAAELGGKLDLLVTDIVMPRMGGRELAETLRRQRPGLKVLFVSGYTEGAIAQSEDLAPGTAFLHKPFTPEDLARKIRELIDAPARK